jgi:hypothetical protein
VEIVKDREHSILSSEEAVLCVKAGNLIASGVVQRYGCQFPDVAFIKDQINQTFK